MPTQESCRQALECPPSATELARPERQVFRLRQRRLAPVWPLLGTVVDTAAWRAFKQQLIRSDLPAGYVGIEDEARHVVHLERLGHYPVCTETTGGVSHLRCAERRHHDDGRVRRNLADRRQQHEIARIRQMVVEHHDIEWRCGGRQCPQGRFAVAASLTKWPLSPKVSESDQRISDSSSTTSTRSDGYLFTVWEIFLRMIGVPGDRPCMAASTCRSFESGNYRSRKTMPLARAISGKASIANTLRPLP
jgi:hypothetical protein